MSKNQNLLIMWGKSVHRVFNKLENYFGEVGLSWATFIILHQLYGKEYLTPRDFAYFDKTSRPAVSRKLNMLQSQNYIRKQRGSVEDQRIVRIYMTEEGREAYLLVIEKMDKLSGIIDKTSIEQLDLLIRKIINDV